jgi:hypothetical protein
VTSLRPDQPLGTLPDVESYVRVAVAFAMLAAHGVLTPAAWSAALEPLAVTPEAGTVAVRVGGSIDFTAAVPGSARFQWSVWGRPVAHGSSWSFVPGPEDAGWQQVTLTVEGSDGERAERAWDVGVVSPIPPVLSEVAPPPGVVSRTAGGTTSFRCAARVPAARATDQLRFEWIVDGALVRQEDRAAAGGASEFELPTAAAGTRLVSVRVSEDGHVTSMAEWTLEVRRSAGEPEPETPRDEVARARPPEREPVEAPPAAVARLLRPAGPRSTARAQGEPLVLAVRAEPADAQVTYDWTVDGRSVKRGSDRRFEYDSADPGRHRIVVTARAGGQEIGTDSWLVTVRPPAPPEPASEAPPAIARTPSDRGERQPASVTTPRAAATRPGALAEDEVRRWFAEYARAWSDKDLTALRRMGQVRSAEDAAKLEQYFKSVADIRVEVKLRKIAIDGAHASVEFERVDTVTDPAGLRRELRLPPLKKEIERTPGGLRFTDRGGAG